MAKASLGASQGRPASDLEVDIFPENGHAIALVGRRGDERSRAARLTGDVTTIPFALRNFVTRRLSENRNASGIQIRRAFAVVCAPSSAGHHLDWGREEDLSQ